MSLTILRPVSALGVLVAILASLEPAYAQRQDPPRASDRARRSTAARIELYSPRVRRSTITYLRLRLLELRELGLDRARAAIERRLSIDDLLATPAIPNGPEKAQRPPRRTDEP